MFEGVCRFVELVGIDGQQGQLVEAAGTAAADIDRRRVDQHGPDAGYGIELGAQAVDHLIGAEFPLGPRFEGDHHRAAGVDVRS